MRWVKITGSGALVLNANLKFQLHGPPVSAQSIPNLFVIGVPKAGSTSLARWLGDNPAISRSPENELRFLMDADDPLCRGDGYHIGGLGGYGRFYPPPSDGSAQTRYRLDVTPQYYYQKTAREVIRTMGEKKLIITLRKPSDRLLSLYKYAQNNVAIVPPQMGFADFVAEIRRGEGSDLVRHRPMLRYALQHNQYARYLADWMRIAGPDNVHVVFFENLANTPLREMRRIARFLDLDPDFYDNYEFTAQNQSVSVRSRRLHQFLRQARKRVPPWLLRRLKPLYIRLNTARHKGELTPRDHATLAHLDDEFQGWESKLAGLLDMDNTTIWPDARRDRTPPAP